jgi:hypothetical protein
MKEKQAFEERKQAALNAAREQGIVDVVTATHDGVSPETVGSGGRFNEKTWANSL